MSRDEILRSGHEPYAKGQMLAALPPVPVNRPVVTEERRGRLRSLQGHILTHRTALQNLEQRERQATAMRERLAAELPNLLLTVSFDDDAALDRVNREERRLQVVANYLRNFPELRRVMLENLSGTMKQLDALLFELAVRGERPTDFYALQNIPLAKCADALALIEEKLRQ